MSEENYFVPDIEDIHIGYECEINSISVNGKDEWNSYIVGEDYENITIARALKEVYPSRRSPGIRVPYLTKEQIEKEGWKYTEENEYYTSGDHGGYILTTEEFHHFIRILDLFDNDYIFYGQCKDINTLRWISKLLKIK